MRAELIGHLKIDRWGQVAFSLGSNWKPVAGAKDEFTIFDDISTKKLISISHTPPAAPLGFTNMLLGLQTPKDPQQRRPRQDMGIQVLALQDAPEGGVCKPTGS